MFFGCTLILLVLISSCRCHLTTVVDSNEPSLTVINSTDGRSNILLGNQTNIETVSNKIGTEETLTVGYDNLTDSNSELNYTIDIDWKEKNVSGLW